MVTPGEYIEFSVWLYSQSQSIVVALSDYTITANHTIVEKDIVVNAARLSINAGSGAKIFGLNKDYDFQLFPNQIGYDAVTTANNVINSTVATNLSSTYHASYFYQRRACIE
ncbi:MAG: hypothetical protein MZU97_10715 [Bacillus subtilis]|nr:hypothetical protein [Bacillus subtilis]